MRAQRDVDRFELVVLTLMKCSVSLGQVWYEITATNGVGSTQCAIMLRHLPVRPWKPDVNHQLV